MTATGYIPVARPAKPHVPTKSRAEVVQELAAARKAESETRAAWVLASREARQLARESAVRVAAARRLVMQKHDAREQIKKSIEHLEAQVSRTAPAWLLDILDRLRDFRAHLFDRTAHQWIVDTVGTHSPEEQEAVRVARSPHSDPNLRKWAQRRIDQGVPVAAFLEKLDAAIRVAEAMLLDEQPNALALTKALAQLPKAPCSCPGLVSLTLEDFTNA